MKKDRLENKLKRVNNPGIDLAIWERLRERWAELQSAGHVLKIDFRLVADPRDEKNILAIDVIQHIEGEIITETVQRNAREAYAMLGIAGLSREQLEDVYKGMMQELHRQLGLKEGVALVVSMSPSSPLSGEVRGYTEKGDSGEKSIVSVNYQHYYLLNALREQMIESTGDGWSKVKAVYRSGDLEFHFE